MKNEKTRVLLFLDRMLHGGIQQFLVENIKHMDKSNLIIDVLTLDDGNTYPLEQTIVDIGANFYKIKGVWINKPTDYIKYAKAIDNFFKEHNDYRVVHMNASSKNYILLKYAKKYNIPIRIAHSHNTDFQTKNKLKIFVGNFFKKKLKKYATDYFACSSLAGEWLFGKEEVDKGNVKVIHNAVDYDKFKYNESVRKAIRKDFNIKDNEILFGNVGRFTNQKNHTFLIDIFNEIHKKDVNTKLIMVGIGEKEEEIKDKVKKLNLEDYVIFAGFRKDVNDIMQAMDVFLLPSLYEGLPVVGVEAQASGLPMFVSDTVSTELKIANNVLYYSLNISAKEWAEKILSSDLNRKDNMLCLKEKKYFISDTAELLHEKYCK